MWLKFTKTKLVGFIVFIGGSGVILTAYLKNDGFWPKDQYISMLYFLGIIIAFMGAIPLIDDIWADWNERP